MIEAATPIKPKKGAEVGHNSEMNTVESIVVSLGRNMAMERNGETGKQTRKNGVIHRYGRGEARAYWGVGENDPTW